MANAPDIDNQSDQVANFRAFWSQDTVEMVKPKCIVFDLDYTLWPFFVDQHLYPPFTCVEEKRTMKIYDKKNRLCAPYDEVNAILELLDELCSNESNRVYLAIASRSSRPNDSFKLMELLNWPRFFQSTQIYPTRKDKHLTQIKQELDLKSFRQMLFYDDTLTSVKTARELGVYGHQLNRTNGLNFAQLKAGLLAYSNSFKSK